MRLEVRCCCVPKKLLGTVEVPAEFVTRHAEINFRREDGSRLTLPVELFKPSQYDRAYLALKSQETPIEVLRTIVGFEEAP